MITSSRKQNDKVVETSLSFVHFMQMYVCHVEVCAEVKISLPAFPITLGGRVSIM